MRGSPFRWTRTTRCSRRPPGVSTTFARAATTVPSELGEEKIANPFLRADDPAMQRLVGMEGGAPEAVFAEIRRRKDNF